MELNENLKAVSVAEGKRIARGVFSLRGNHFEAHMQEEELASLLSLAVEHGVKAVIHGILRQPDKAKLK